MIIQYGDYQIRPHSNRLCWELWRYREVKGKDGEVRKDWVSERTYPTTLGFALARVQEMSLMEGEEVVGLEEALRRVDASRERIIAIGTRVEEADAWQD